MVEIYNLLGEMALREFEKAPLETTRKESLKSPTKLSVPMFVLFTTFNIPFEIGWDPGFILRIQIDLAEFKEFVGDNAKERISKRTKVTRKQSTTNFPKNEHFLHNDMHAYVCASVGNKCSLFE